MQYASIIHMGWVDLDHVMRFFYDILLIKLVERAEDVWEEPLLAAIIIITTF